MIYPEIVKDFFRFRDQVVEIKKYNRVWYNYSLYKYFLKWRFFKAQSDTLKFKLPWITFPAIDFLNRSIRNEMKVFEYGGGGSTLFFAERVSKIVSVEHDLLWNEKLKKTVEKNEINNVELFFQESIDEECTEQIYTSANDNYSGKSFKDYVLKIEKFPDNYFDIILIDGRARNGCFLKSISKVKRDGIIVFDNTERIRYRTYFKQVKGTFTKLEFPGPTPFTKLFTVTTVFIKR